MARSQWDRDGDDRNRDGDAGQGHWRSAPDHSRGDDSAPTQKFPSVGGSDDPDATRVLRDETRYYPQADQRRSEPTQVFPSATRSYQQSSYIPPQDGGDDWDEDDDERGSSNGTTVATVIAVILAIGLAAVAGWLAWDRWGSGGEPAATTTAPGTETTIVTETTTVEEAPEQPAEPTTTETQPGPPPPPEGAEEVLSNRHATVYRVEPTSEEFAEAVYDAWRDEDSPTGAFALEASSSVTGQDYVMQCSGEERIECFGGENGHVIIDPKRR